MHVMRLDRPRERLVHAEVPVPEPTGFQVLLRVLACGVCRTDLHVVDGDLVRPKLPIVPGHEIVAEVVALGDAVDGLVTGQRVGVPWLAWTCGECRYCLSGRENLCILALFTGYDVDGGYAEYTLADSRYCLPLPDGYDDVHAAPLLCAGLIGYRCLRVTGDPRRLGIYGFGAAAHIVTQVARAQGREVYALTRPGDEAAQRFALDTGAVWAGGSDEKPPEELDAAIIFAPVGPLVPAALQAVAPGGVVVAGGIHMSDIPAFPYEILWGERVLRSVANLTRADGREFLDIADRTPIRLSVEPYPLGQANAALDRLRAGELTGAAVLVP